MRLSLCLWISLPVREGLLRCLPVVSFSCFFLIQSQLPINCPLDSSHWLSGSHSLEGEFYPVACSTLLHSLGHLARWGWGGRWGSPPCCPSGPNANGVPSEWKTKGASPTSAVPSLISSTMPSSLSFSSHVSLCLLSVFADKLHKCRELVSTPLLTPIPRITPGR